MDVQVVKWAMHHICTVDVHLWPNIGHDDWLHGAFMQGLNHVILYVRDGPKTVPKLAHDLIEFLQKCANLPDEQRRPFFHRFLKGSLIFF